MEYLVHIGMPKTGTTALQSFLSWMQPQLLNLGWQYNSAKPNKTSNPWFESFRPIFLKGKSPEDLQRIINDTRKTLTDISTTADKHLISAEVLTNANPEMISDVFSFCSARYIAYVRNELDFLASSYAQLAHREERIPSLDEFLKSRANRHNGLFLQKWSHVVGPSLSARLFDKQRLIRGDIVADFIEAYIPEAAHLLALDTAPSLDDNPSLTDIVIQFKRQLSEHSPELVTHNKHHYRALAELASRHGSKFRLPKKYSRALPEYFEKEARAWSPRFFGEELVFDYANYKFNDDKADITLSPEQMSALKEEYLSLVHQSKSKP